MGVASELSHTVPGHLLSTDHARACLCGCTHGRKSPERAIRCGAQELTFPPLPIPSSYLVIKMKMANFHSFCHFLGVLVRDLLLFRLHLYDSM